MLYVYYAYNTGCIVIVIPKYLIDNTLSPLTCLAVAWEFGLGIIYYTSYLIADHQVILTGEVENSNYLLRKLRGEYKRWRLMICIEKT